MTDVKIKVAETSTATVNLSLKTHTLFPTTLAVAAVPGGEDLAETLRGVIEGRRKADEGVNKSNHLGWHSSGDMLQWGGDSARRLHQFAIQAAGRLSSFRDTKPEDVVWGSTMWANVSGPNAQNKLHVHSGNLWAAVFYVDLGESEPGEKVGGELYFQDPRYPLPTMAMAGFNTVGADGKVQTSETELTPKKGQLLLFPAWLAHGVRPYTGRRDRISIAMNITATPRAILQAHARTWDRLKG
ncbi:TIGR02466 family protein [Brevundimonas sp.]